MAEFGHNENDLYYQAQKQFVENFAQVEFGSGVDIALDDIVALTEAEVRLEKARQFPSRKEKDRQVLDALEDKNTVETRIRENLIETDDYSKAYIDLLILRQQLMDNANFLAITPLQAALATFRFIHRPSLKKITDGDISF